VWQDQSPHRRELQQAPPPVSQPFNTFSRYKYSANSFLVRRRELSPSDLRDEGKVGDPWGGPWPKRLHQHGVVDYVVNGGLPADWARQTDLFACLMC
jgi:hypothetical protein